MHKRGKRDKGAREGIMQMGPAMRRLEGKRWDRMRPAWRESWRFIRRLARMNQEYHMYHTQRPRSKRSSMRRQSVLPCLPRISSCVPFSPLSFSNKSPPLSVVSPVRPLGLLPPLPRAQTCSQASNCDASCPRKKWSEFATRYNRTHR